MFDAIFQQKQLSEIHTAPSASHRNTMVLQNLSAETLYHEIEKAYDTLTQDKNFQFLRQSELQGRKIYRPMQFDCAYRVIVAPAGVLCDFHRLSLYEDVRRAEDAGAKIYYLKDGIEDIREQIEKDFESKLVQIDTR